MILAWGADTVKVTKVKGGAEDVDVQQGRVRLVDQQRNALPLTWVVVVSLRCSFMPGVGCSWFVLIGILSCLICIGLWLLLLGSLVIMMGGGRYCS